RDREEELERLNQAADAAKTAIDETEKKRAALSSELSGSADGITSSMGELTTEKTARSEDRAKVVAKLPSVLYRRYESIRTRRPVRGALRGLPPLGPPVDVQEDARAGGVRPAPNRPPHPLLHARRRSAAALRPLVLTLPPHVTLGPR